MRLLANENFPLRSADILKAAGFDVKVVGVEFRGNHGSGSHGDSHPGGTDHPDVRPASGVIYLRWRQFAPEEPGRYLAGLLKSTEIDFGEQLRGIVKR